MEAQANNKLQIKKKVDKNRRQYNREVRAQLDTENQSENNFRLNKDDFQELIEIKKEKVNKSKHNSIMFFYIGLSMALLLVITAFEWKFQDVALVNDMELMQVADFDEILEVPPTEQPPPPPPQALQQHVIVEVPNDVVLEEVEILIDVEISEEMVVQQVEYEEMELEEEEAEEIFQIVEETPAPIGGFKAFYKFVGENIKYPESALRMEISGRVFVKFVVDKEGNIKNVEVLKGIGGGCDEEAIRIIEMSPKWKPGKQRGKEVNVYMMLPIIFKYSSK